MAPTERDTPGFNLEQFLGDLPKPISEESPGGKDLQNQSKAYGEILVLVEQAEAGTNRLKWDAIISKAKDVLLAEGKHLVVTAWFCRALTRRYALPGLYAGLAILRELHTSCWEHFHPQIATDSARVKAGRALFEREGAAAYMDVSDDISEIEARIKAAAKATLEEIANWRLWIEAAQSEVRLLLKLVEKKYGPNSSPVKCILANEKTLAQCALELAKLEKRRRQELGIPTANPSPALQPDQGKPGNETTPGTVVSPTAAHELDQDLPSRLVPRSPLEAMRILEEVAQYLRQSDPHNPVSYMVLHAVAWGRKGLSGWFPEIVTDQELRNYISKLMEMEKKRNEQRT